MVMDRNWRLLLAPSMEAASYRSSGTPLSAAKNSTMAEPNCHTRSRQIMKSAQSRLARKLMDSKPSIAKMVLTTPSDLNSARQSTAMATDPPRMDGT